MNNQRHILTLIVIASTFGIAACSSGQQAGEQQAPTVGNPSSPPTSTSLKHSQARLSLEGVPSVSADGKDLLLLVNVTNTGPATFGSETTPNNVNLGAHSIDASGKIIDNDVARGHLPQIAPGAEATATILLPIDKVLNKRAELLPVQENVAWFDQWGTRPLIVGPFNGCSSDALGRVCDATGKPLPTVGEKH